VQFAKSQLAQSYSDKNRPKGLLQGWYSQQQISFDILMIILKARKDYLQKTNHCFGGG
jgi:hypothetical protein